MTEEVKMERDCKKSCHFGLIVVLVVLLVTTLPALWYFMKRDSQRFQVSHIHRVESADSKVTMYCMASNCPEDVKVTWRITENDGEKIIISDIKQEKDEEAAPMIRSDYTVETDRSHEDKLHHVVSSLSFRPVVSKHKEMVVSCTFQCKGRSQEKSRTFSFTFKKPESSDSVKMSLGDNGDVLCSVSLQNFYPKDIKIQWSHGLGEFKNVETTDEKFTKNNDFTFNVRSECRIPGHVLKDQGCRVRATWSHNAECGQKEVSIMDFPECRPVMGEIEKPTFTDGKEAKLLCRVSGYFPDVLDVKWLRRDADGQEFYVVSGDKYNIPVMEATQQEDKTFTYTACLILSVSAATHYGSEFMCRVRHPSVTGALEQTTGQIKVIGIRAMNVTLLNKEKLRAEVLHFTPNDIKITWSRSEKKNKSYKVYENPEKLAKRENSDGSCTSVSEITFKSHLVNTKNAIKYYKVAAEDDASNAVVEKIILRENSEYYLTDNENKKTPLAQISEQQCQ